MATIVDYWGRAADAVSDDATWTAGDCLKHWPALDRAILDMIDRLGYLPSEAAAVLGVSLGRVVGTFWRARWSVHRVANRICDLLRDDAAFDPRHALVFELSTVCGYTFVEIGEFLGYDRGHCSRIASDTAKKLRERLGDRDILEALTAADAVPVTDADCRLMFARNAVLGTLDRARLWREMLDQGDFASAVELAAAVGVSASTVRNALRLVTLPAEWLRRVERGELGLSHLRPLVRLRHRPAVLSALSRRSVRGVSFRKWCEIVRDVSDGERS